MVNWRRRPPQEELDYLQAEDDGLLARPTGDWALHKLAILSNYFRRFNQASQRSRTRNYVDGFAGPGLNFIPAGGGEFIWGSPLLASRAIPAFTDLLLMEENANAHAALQARLDHDRRARVIQGDCNELLASMMRTALNPLAPTLCVLDPNGVELRWSTVEEVSRFRSGPRKTELLITFARNMALLRLLRVRGDIDDATRFLIDRYFGTREWEPIYEQRVSGTLQPAQASERYLHLYENRLRDVLEYKHVFSTTVRRRGNEGGPLYLLTFASDDDAGDRIMRYVFERMTPLDPKLRLF